jgi:hypothetical protein
LLAADGDGAAGREGGAGGAWALAAIAIEEELAEPGGVERSSDSVTMNDAAGIPDDVVGGESSRRTIT